MLRKLSRRLSYANVMSTIAVVVAVGTGSAYAANEWTGDNIVDGSLTGADIFNNTVSGADITNGSLTGADVFDNTLGGADITNGSLTNADIQDFSLGNGDFLTGSVDGRVATDNSLTGFDIQNGRIGQVDLVDGAVNSAKTADNSLTGTDINEATLNLPQNPTTATFPRVGQGAVTIGDAFTKVIGKPLAAGSWAIVATANTRHPGGGFAETRDTVCELRNGTDFIGNALDRRTTPAGDATFASLSMNGGAQVPAGGGEVSLWCRHQGGSGELLGAQMMITRLDGFF